MPREGVSISKIKTFIKCQKQYQHRYINKTPEEFTGSALVLGSALHATIESYTKSQGGISPSKYFEDHFNDLIFQKQVDGKPVQWDQWGSYEEDLRRGKEMVERYLGRKSDTYVGGQVYAEVPFMCDIPGLEDEMYIEGIIDGLSAVLPPKEYKSTAAEPENWFLQNDIQMLGYAYAIENGKPVVDIRADELTVNEDLLHLFGVLPERIEYVALNSLNSKKKPWHVKGLEYYCYPTREKMDMFVKEVQSAWRLMKFCRENGIFLKAMTDPTTAPCRLCAYRKSCFGE